MAAQSSKKPKVTNRRQPTGGSRSNLVAYAEHEYLADPTKHLSQGTQEQIFNAIRLVSELAGRDATIGDLSVATLESVAKSMKSRRKSVATVNKVRRTLLALWRHAASRGYCEPPPKVELLPEPTPSPTAWTSEEFARIVAAADSYPGNHGLCPVPNNRWWGTILRLAWMTTLRSNELMELRSDAIDPATGLCTLPQSRRPRPSIIELDAATMAALESITLPTRSLVFARGCGSRSLSAEFREILAAAEVAEDTQSNLGLFSKLRRSRATEIAVRDGISLAAARLGITMEEIETRYLDPAQVSACEPAGVVWLQPPAYVPPWGTSPPNFAPSVSQDAVPATRRGRPARYSTLVAFIVADRGLEPGSEVTPRQIEPAILKWRRDKSRSTQERRLAELGRSELAKKVRAYLAEQGSARAS